MLMVIVYILCYEFCIALSIKFVFTGKKGEDPTKVEWDVVTGSSLVCNEDDYLYGGLVFLANKDFVKALDLFTKYLKVTGENNLSSALINSYYYEIRQYISRDEYTLFINQLFMNI